MESQERKDDFKLLMWKEGIGQRTQESNGSQGEDET